MPSDLQGQKWLIHLSATGHVRTRQDAETMAREIEEKGWKEDLRALYHAILALLGDKHAITTLPMVDRVLAKTTHNAMLKHYVGNAICTCPVPLVVVPGRREPAADCPVHKRREPCLEN